MPGGKGKHLNFDDRCEIEEMLKEKKPFRAIAKALGVSATTVSNEVKANRTFGSSKALTACAQSRCSLYKDCRTVGLCERHASKAAACKRCGKKRCFDICSKFSPISCPKLDRAPFVCTGCFKRAYCTYGRARYVASKAQLSHDGRVREAQASIQCSQRELEAMVAKVRKLLSQGQSLEAIWAARRGEFPVSVRTFYNYMDRGVMGMSNMELPKKARYAPRKERESAGPKMDMEGRTYSDWQALPREERLLTVQIDTVEGLRRNSKCILSLHFVRLFFQIYLLLEEKTQADVKAVLDALEAYCKGAFEEAFPVLLGDRGSEFSGCLKIEEGLDGRRRTRMFYCDPVKPAQKGTAEKNHVELGKVLPKGSDFDVSTPGTYPLHAAM